MAVEIVVASTSIGGGNADAEEEQLPVNGRALVESALPQPYGSYPAILGVLEHPLLHVLCKLAVADTEQPPIRERASAPLLTVPALQNTGSLSLVRLACGSNPLGACWCIPLGFWDSAGQAGQLQP